jgi:triphosphoribosyl-dephospho-CoA synthetase
VLRVFQCLVEAIDLSVYSYVKPGAVHRFSIYDLDTYKYVRTVVSALDTYLQSITLGESVAKGVIGFPSVGIGRLVSQAITSSLSKLGINTVVELHITLIPTVIASSYTLTNEKQLNLSTFRKALTTMMTYSDVIDALEVYGVLKKLDKFSKVFEDSGLTEGVIRTNHMNLRSIYQVLGKHIRPLTTLVDKLDIIVGMSSKFIKVYEETYDLNLATISAYLHGLENIYGLSFKITTTKQSSITNELYRLDKELRSKGLNFNDMIPILCTSTLLSLLTIEK